MPDTLEFTKIGDLLGCDVTREAMIGSRFTALVTTTYQLKFFIDYQLLLQFAMFVCVCAFTSRIQV